MSDDLEFRIARLDLRDGDIIVVKVVPIISGETRASIRDYVARLSGGHQVMVLDGGADVTVLTQSEIAERMK